MNHLKQNLQFLQENAPDIFRTVTAAPAHAGETTIIPTIPAGGNAVVKTATGECYLHSLYDSEREFARLCRDVNHDAKVVILFGLGMGHPLKFIAEAFPALEHLFIVEPNAAVFQAFLAQADLGDYFRRFPQVSLIVNRALPETQENLIGLINDERYNYAEFIALTSYRTLYRDYYQGVYQTILETVRNFRVSVVTQRFYANRWLINAWRNLKCPGIELDYLLPMISPLPVIIVSAGPSLNKNINLLPAAKEKALIVAVGSAMTVLESHGITPHFRMAIDGNEDQKKIFEKVDTAQCPLLYSDVLYHEILPAYAARKVQMVLVSSHLSRFINKLLGKRPTLLTTGFSVANIAFDLACRGGCPKVILVGQDLCYTEDKWHATGAWDDKDPFRKVNKQTMRKVKDIHNRDVYTESSFLGIKGLLEEIASHYPDIDFINASEGGLPLKGVHNKTLQAVLDEDLVEDLQVSSRIEQALQAVAPEDSALLAGVIEMIEEQLRGMLDICGKSMSRLKQLMETIGVPQKNAANLQALNEIREDLLNVRKTPYFYEVLFHYVEDRLRLIELDAGQSEQDAQVQTRKFFESLVGQAAIIDEVLSLAKVLLMEYKGEGRLTVEYEK